MKRLPALLVLAAFCLSSLGCGLALKAVGASVAASQVEEPGDPKSQLQVRELQTRTYGTRDTKLVMKTMLNVLQDDGFIVKEANMELGFLTASKEMEVATKAGVFWGSLIGGTWEKGAVVEVTANVSEFGKETRVRANFAKVVYDNMGKKVKAQQISEPKFYQDFFAKVDKGVFLQKEKL